MRFSTFANRYQQNAGTVQLMEDLGKATAAEGPIYQLEANPAHIPEVETLLQEAMADLSNDAKAFGRMIGEYDSPGGNQPFQDALADLLQNTLGWSVSAENIAITNGSQSSFGLLFNSFAGRFADGSRKKILLPLTPEYVGYFDVGLSEQPIFGGRRPEIDLLPDRQFKYRVDFKGWNWATGTVQCAYRPPTPRATSSPTLKWPSCAMPAAGPTYR